MPKCSPPHLHMLKTLQRQPTSTAHQRGSTTTQRTNNWHIWHGTLRCRTKCSRTPPGGMACQRSPTTTQPTALLLLLYKAAPTFASAAAATISAGLAAQLQRASSCPSPGLKQSSNVETSLRGDLATATAAATLALCARPTLHYCVVAHCCCCWWWPTQCKPWLHYLTCYANLWRCDTASDMRHVLACRCTSGEAHDASAAARVQPATSVQPPHNPASSLQGQLLSTWRASPAAQQPAKPSPAQLPACKPSPAAQDLACLVSHSSVMSMLFCTLQDML
jgi:hypothetical protein